MDIKANVSRMFDSIEPWDVSNSVANLGPRAAQLTWENALRIAAKHTEWLLSDLNESCDGMRGWARDTGAWDRAEIEDWTSNVCLALFVQNIASELRNLGADDFTLSECVEGFTANPELVTDVVGHYFLENGNALVDYYTGR